MISQPRYLPSLSYLRRIKDVDVFIILDNVQREARGFENRNKLDAGNGNPKWLTIPVKGSERMNMQATRYRPFADEHLMKIEAWYGRSAELLKIKPYWHEFVQGMYAQDITASLVYLMQLLDIRTHAYCASLFNVGNLTGVPLLEKLFHMVGGTTYVTGAGFLDYATTHHFTDVEVDTWVPDIYPERAMNYLGWVHYYLRYGKEFVMRKLMNMKTIEKQHGYRSFVEDRKLKIRQSGAICATKEAAEISAYESYMRLHSQ